MGLSIADELRRAFDLAALRRESASIDSARQWASANRIMSRCEAARAREKGSYAARYDTRVEVVRRRLIDQAGETSRDLKPPWAGEDRFSPADTLLQAQREVRDAHHRRIARIEDVERRQLQALVQQSMRENNLRGVAREGFGRAAERRQGFDRRRGRDRP